MNTEELYDEIKAALDFFGLKFNQMNQITIAIDHKAIIFTHGAKSIRIEIGS